MSNWQGIAERHARSCNPKVKCTCAPTYQAHVWDGAAGKRIRKTFPTISAARRWRQDAIVAVRAGDLSADRGPILKEAAMAWIDGYEMAPSRTARAMLTSPSSSATTTASFALASCRRLGTCASAR